MFCVQRNQISINDGTWRRNWVCAFRASNHPQLHAVIELSQLNPSVETFSPPQAAAGDTSTNGAANPATCGVTVEAASVVPVILEAENGIIIRTNAFLVDSGSSYLKE